MKMDLHCHSSYSDGIYSPFELCKRAQAKELDIFSITDHDTIDGIAKILQNVENYSFAFIPGIELSVDLGTKSFELLGYNFSLTSNELNDLIHTLQTNRRLRVDRLFQRLEELGLKISHDDIQQELSDTSSPGRPHFARALLKKGYVASVDEAFELYLKRGASAYIPKYAPTMESAIKMVLQTKGTPVLPHPLLLEAENLTILEEYLDKFISWGLKGIEVFYNYSLLVPSIPAKTVRKGCKFLYSYAKNNDLLITGGTDYHGEIGNVGEIDIPQDIVTLVAEYFALE